MKKQVVLFVSRHRLWDIQKAMLRRMHGRKIQIVYLNIRFENLKEFIVFLKQNSDYYIYPVIPDGWRKKAIEMGIPLGVAHRPKFIKQKNSIKTELKIEYWDGTESRLITINTKKRKKVQKRKK